MTSILAGQSVGKRFGPTAALRDVDIQVAAGELVAVMGPSGSGKSTLLHVLSGILIPGEGQVFFNDRSLSSMSETDRTRLRRTSFGFVFQHGHLVAELSALENVVLPLLLEGVGRREARDRAMHWLTRFEVDGLAQRRPGAMSGGQMQRIACARALVVEPQVIFADEPTGALDTLAGERVMEALVEAAVDHGAAVVLVTHDGRVAAQADREVRMRDGGIVDPVTVGL